MRLLAISGSLRRASTNTALLEALAANAPEGISVEIFRGVGDLPIFNPDDEDNAPAVVRDMLAAVRSSDGLIVSSPEYAHGMPGGLKNALDWMVSHDVAVGKPAMLVHASLRSAHSREHLTEVMRTMSFALHDGDVLEVGLLGKRPDQFAAILDEAGMRQRLTAVLAGFAVHVEAVAAGV